MTRRGPNVLRLLTTLVLLLATSASAKDVTDPSPAIPGRQPLGASSEPYFSTEDDPSRRREIGTKDAPVDGLDGKPHAGPFVDAKAALRDIQDTADRIRPPGGKTSDYRDKATAEDGVMNDPNRKAPKQGTTGTEGGVSEKDRDRRIQEFSTGERVAKIPDPPKSSMGDDAATTTKSASSGATGIDRERRENEKDKGFVGLEKPGNLPEKSYNIDAPVGVGSGGHITTEKHDSSLNIEKHSNDDDDDDDDADDDEDDDDGEDGEHDIIPWDSLVGSFSSIAATEIGDKTFIVAALMAMRHSKFQVFTAAFSALFIMTILSGVAGHAMGAIVSKRWSALLAALLFLVFGAKSLREGMEMSPDQGVSEEIREVEAELEEKEGEMARHTNGHRRQSSISPYVLEAGRANGRKSRSRSRLNSRRSPSDSRSPSPSKASVKTAISGIKNLLSLLLSPAWVETFSMTFVGELGDRSQIATVAMAAGQEYYWVMVGASLGHFVCTAIAVLGGSVLAGRVSLRKVTLVGGGIFIFFGIFTFIEAVRYWT